MTSRRGAAAAALLLVLPACGGDDQPLPEPISAASEAPSPEPTRSTSPSPSPSPSPPPLSPFEDDPAVQALRAGLVAATEAINTQDLRLPALLAVTTANRQGRLADLYAEDLGTFFPGPVPTAVLGVRVVSPTAREVPVCLLDDGWALDRPGGTPTEPRSVIPGIYEVVLEGEAWKVDRAVLDETRTCDQGPLPGEAA